MTDATITYSTPIPTLSAGTTHAGFTVISAEHLPEISGCAYVFRHDASGARALWLACPDDNTSFSIAFKTPPADDTGVFHILEHSVLCGSDSYPVKEPFVNLLKTSMQTFLNALTFPDKTMYPVASTNTADLENLMGVYLDAVLHPAIYRRPRIFEQEGWHYEMDDEDAPLTYNGVVFNEMRGALSDPDEVLYLGIQRALFPDTPYRFESGGHPRSIPTLTYERFLDTHARHYALANSYTVLYGDLDVDRELAFVDEHFRSAALRDVGEPNPLPLQPAIAAGLSRIDMATTPENASVGLAYVVGTSADRERVLATDILLDAIAGSNEAPLKRRVLDAGLADDFLAILVDGVYQPQVLFQLKGAHEGVAEEFRSLVESVCAELAEGGIARDRLSASLAQAEFNLREGDWGGYPDGVALSMQVMSSWLYDNDRPYDYVRYEGALADIKAGLDEGYFERLLRELVSENTHSAEVALVPVTEGDASEETAELAARRKAMTREERLHVIDEVASLREEQERPDAPDDMATLPVLTVADIGRPKPEPQAAPAEAPLPCIAHELDTHRIDYVYHYFDLRRLSFDDLPYVGVLCDLLGKLDTADHSASDLDTLIEESLGGLGFFAETYTHDSDLSYARPTLVVGASALAEKVDRLAEIPQEVWGRTSFADAADMHDILTQRRIGLEQYFIGSGHSASLGRVSTYFSSASLVAGQMSGIDYYLFLKNLLAHWDERFEDLSATLARLCRTIFTSDEVTVSFIGSPEDRKRFWETGGTLGLSPSGSTPHVLRIPTPRPRCEGFAVPANVSFVCEGFSPSATDTGTSGAWEVATRALSLDYLWNEVRVKGGAYGVGFKRKTEGIRAFWSYRDPSVDATLGRYAGATEWLRSWSPEADELSGYVVSTVASHDAPTKPRAMARRQDMLAFSDRPEGWRDDVRHQELAATPEAVRALAEALADGSCSHGVCVFGPLEAIQASSVDFEITELIGRGEE